MYEIDSIVNLHELKSSLEQRYTSSWANYFWWAQLYYTVLQILGKMCYKYNYLDVLLSKMFFIFVMLGQIIFYDVTGEA